MPVKLHWMIWVKSIGTRSTEGRAQPVTKLVHNLGIHCRHPYGNVSHFVSALELFLNELDNGRTTILVGDMNIIDIIKFANIDVIFYMTTMMTYKYLPYITLPSRITLLSTACIDHIFMKKSHSKHLKYIVWFILLRHKWSPSFFLIIKT